MDINAGGRTVPKSRRSSAYGAGMESDRALMKGKSQVLEAVESWRKRNEPSLVVWVEVSRMLLAVVGKPKVVHLREGWAVELKTEREDYR